MFGQGRALLGADGDADAHRLAPGRSRGRRAASTTKRPSPGPSATGMPSASSSAWSSSARTAGRREVVADDQRVGAREQAHRLELAEHVLAPAGEPQPRARQHEAEQRDRLQRLAGRDQPLVAERRARSGARKLIGTSHGSSSASSNAKSMRCSSVSPMPRMPPQHSSMPASMASRAVATRSS